MTDEEIKAELEEIGLVICRCSACAPKLDRVVALVRSVEARAREEAIEAEQQRCVQACLNEYGRWKDAGRDSHGIAIGAIGAASNILCAIERIPSIATTPLNENEHTEADCSLAAPQTEEEKV